MFQQNYLQQIVVRIWLKARSLSIPRGNARQTLVMPQKFSSMDGMNSYMLHISYYFSIHKQFTILEVSCNQQNRHDMIFITGELFQSTSFRYLQVCWVLFFCFLFFMKPSVNFNYKNREFHARRAVTNHFFRSLLFKLFKVQTLLLIWNQKMVQMAWVSKTHKKIIYQLNSSNFPYKVFVMHRNTFKTSYSYNKKNSLADIVNSDSSNVKGSQPILNLYETRAVLLSTLIHNLRA